MENSFLNGIISSALAAQDAQESGNFSESSFGGITEKDGYVGEMVKASLAIFEAKKPADYGQKFDSDVTVVLTSMEANVSGTNLELDYDADNAAVFESVQDIIDFASEMTELDLSGAEASCNSSEVVINKETEYGPAKISMTIEAYKPVPLNSVLNLPSA